MKNNVENKKDAVQDLFNLPVKNLEKRIRSYEQEIEDRLKINLDVLSKLTTSQLRFKQQIFHLRYALLPSSITTKANFDIEITRLEERKLKEKIDCFRDVLQLRYRVREAKEELEKERLKMRLME